ncbi:hypothetical protein SMD22_01015 (plasmid) [Brevibacillus halotolerans]|nr:hypothetical protein SMD22_01015 [Brevibacillus halotolerans]
MEKICGKCSQDKEISLEERIKLAKSRLPNVDYFCPVCLQEHSLKWNVGAIRKESDLTMVKEVVQKTKKNRKEQGLEQLDFFNMQN